MHRRKVTPEQLFGEEGIEKIRIAVAFALRAPEPAEGAQNATVERLLKTILKRACKSAQIAPDDPDAFHNQLQTNQTAVISTLVEATRDEPGNRRPSRASTGSRPSHFTEHAHLHKLGKGHFER